MKTYKISETLKNAILLNTSATEVNVSNATLLFSICGWNGKIYNNTSIFIRNNKIELSDLDLAFFKEYEEKFAKYILNIAKFELKREDEDNEFYTSNANYEVVLSNDNKLEKSKKIIAKLFKNYDVVSIAIDNFNLELTKEQFGKLV